MSVIYDRVALIGLGLIASSMAHAMRRAGLAGEITGYARSAETRKIAADIGLCGFATVPPPLRKVPIWLCYACPWGPWAMSPPKSPRS